MSEYQQMKAAMRLHEDTPGYVESTSRMYGKSREPKAGISNDALGEYIYSPRSEDTGTNKDGAL